MLLEHLLCTLVELGETHPVPRQAVELVIGESLLRLFIEFSPCGFVSVNSMKVSLGLLFNLRLHVRDVLRKPLLILIACILGNFRQVVFRVWAYDVPILVLLVRDALKHPQVGGGLKVKIGANDGLEQPELTCVLIKFNLLQQVGILGVLPCELITCDVIKEGGTGSSCFILIILVLRMMSHDRQTPLEVFDVLLAHVLVKLLSHLAHALLLEGGSLNLVLDTTLKEDWASPMLLGDNVAVGILLSR